jgi:hypothetical protein
MTMVKKIVVRKVIKKPTPEQADAKRKALIAQLQADDARRAAQPVIPEEIPYKSYADMMAERDRERRQRDEELNRRMVRDIKIPEAKRVARPVQREPPLEGVEVGSELRKHPSEWRPVMISSFPREFVERCVEEKIPDSEIAQMLKSAGIRDVKSTLTRLGRKVSP